MSVRWKTEYFGYDGDFIHGHLKVNYWQDRDMVEAELARQFAEIRDEMLAEWTRLTGRSSMRELGT